TARRGQGRDPPSEKYIVGWGDAFGCLRRRASGLEHRSAALLRSVRATVTRWTPLRAREADAVEARAGAAVVLSALMFHVDELQALRPDDEPELTRFVRGLRAELVDFFDAPQPRGD